MKTKAASIHLLALAAAVLWGGSAARASTLLYNVDLNDTYRYNNAADTYAGAAVLGNPGDSWNGVVGTAPNTLQSTTQGAPPITFGTAMQYIDGYASGGTTANPALLMQDYFYESGYNKGTVTLTGLTPGATFTLVLYGAGDQAGQGDTFGLTGGIGGNTASALTTSGDDRDISHGIGDAYNTYTGTIDSGGSLTVSVTTNGLTQYGPLNGLQFEETVVPEPGTWLGGALLLGGAAWTLRRRA